MKVLAHGKMITIGATAVVIKERTPETATIHPWFTVYYADDWLHYVEVGNDDVIVHMWDGSCFRFPLNRYKIRFRYL